MDTITFKILNEVSKNGRRYIVLAVHEHDPLPAISAPNLIAVDQKGNIIWLVERPTTGHDRYGNVYFKDNKLFCLSAGSQLHQIDEETGRVISSKMIK